MFENKRYLTRGVEAEIPLAVQVVIWGLIDTMKVEKDYLQVFSLKAEDNRQGISHSQEVPGYKKEYTLFFKEPVNAKIYVIDDGNHTTMLLSEEY